MNNLSTLTNLWLTFNNPNSWLNQTPTVHKYHLGTIMNITEIKTQIGATHGFPFGTMPLQRQFNEVVDPQDPAKKVKVATEWVSFWENTKRVRVVMHQDLMAELKDNPNKGDLALKAKVEPAVGTRLAYTMYIVITPKDIEAVF